MRQGRLGLRGVMKHSVRLISSTRTEDWIVAHRREASMVNRQPIMLVGVAFVTEMRIPPVSAQELALISCDRK